MKERSQRFIGRIKDDFKDPARSNTSLLALMALGYGLEEVGYTSDIALTTAEASVVARFGANKIERRTLKPAVTALTINSAIEVTQRFDFLPQTVFDPKDFLWYTLGTLLWVGIDKASTKYVRRRSGS